MSCVGDPAVGFIAPCVPKSAPQPLWLREIKHDGFRVIAQGGKLFLPHRSEW
jgi:hypothetical protein